MTEQELKGATDALIRWFESQDINPQQAMMVMTDTIACIIIDPEETRDEIQERADLFHQMLNLYIDKVSHE